MEHEPAIGPLDHPPLRNRGEALRVLECAVRQLAADGYPATGELPARLSPLPYDHIYFVGRSASTRPSAPGLQQQDAQVRPALSQGRWPKQARSS